MQYTQRYIVYHEDEWTNETIIDQVIYAQNYAQAKAQTNKMLSDEYMSPYHLKQQD